MFSLTNDRSNALTTPNRGRTCHDDSAGTANWGVFWHHETAEMSMDPEGPVTVVYSQRTLEILLTLEDVSRRNESHLGSSGAGVPMLQSTNPAIMHCLERAAECECLAKHSLNPESRTTFYRIAEHWRSLATSPEYIERFETLLGIRTDH